MLCLTASQGSSFSNTSHAVVHPATTRSHTVDVHCVNCAPVSQTSEAANHRADRQGGQGHSEWRDRLTAMPGQEKQGSRVMTWRGQQTCLVTPASEPTAPVCHRSVPQRRWSTSVCEVGRPSLIVVRKKSMTRPEPPRRSSSLPSSDVSSKSSLKRHSCPPDSFRLPFASPPPPSTASSSAPVVRTSLITGASPLGCKMRPRPSSSSSRARLARLSLQLPSSTAPFDLSPYPAPSCDPVNSTATTQPPPKPSRRRHSETSVFLRSLATPQPLVTQRDLSAVQLRPVQCFDEPGCEFGDGDEEEPEEKAVPRGRKVPPPVAAKTAESKWRSYFLAESLPLPDQALANQEETLYSTVRKPRAEINSQQEDHCSKVSTGLEDGRRRVLSSASSCQSDAGGRDRVGALPFTVRAAARLDVEMKRRSLPPLIPPKPQIELQAWLCMDDPIEREATLAWLKGLRLSQED